ncbi:MAG: hypothetical protein AAB795_03410 [Patescibacteria group bacterium]
MEKLVTYDEFTKRREGKPVPLVDCNEKRQSAEILPFSKGVISKRKMRGCREKLRLQIKELRKTLVTIGLPPNPEFMLFVVCYWRDQLENSGFAQTEQYRHLRMLLMRRGQLILEKYRWFAIAMGKLGILLPNFSWELMQKSNEPPDDTA